MTDYDSLSVAFGICCSATILIAGWSIRSAIIQHRANLLLEAYRHTPFRTRDDMAAALLGLRGDRARERAHKLRAAFESCYPDLFEIYRLRSLI